MAKNNKEYITTTEAAKILKVSKGTMSGYRIHDKGPPYYKDGRAIRYLKSDVVEYAKTHEPGMTFDPERAERIEPGKGKG